MTSESFRNFPVVCFGETLWEMLPTGSFHGGAPLHVAYHFHKLGLSPAIITRVGPDIYGKSLIQLLESQNISTDFFQMDHVLPTGRVQANVDQHDILLDFQKPAAWDNIQWEPGFEQLIAGSKYFIFGSLAARGTSSRQTLFQLLEQAPCTVLNMNLQPPHYNRATISEILQKADFLKLSISELELITGWFVHFNTDNDRIRVLQDRFSINHVLVTKATGGSLVNIDGHLYSQPALPGATRHSPETDDAFLAGMLYKLMQSAPIEEAHQFASAMGALVASQARGWPEYGSEEISQFTANKTVTSSKFK